MTRVDKKFYSDAGKALKILALDPELRNVFEKSTLLRSILAGPASRYILPDRTAEAITRLLELKELGYRLGVERVGEEINSLDGVNKYVEECIELIETFPLSDGGGMQLGFDLSALGLNFDQEVAFTNAAFLAGECKKKNINIVLSMERSEKTTQILDIYQRLCESRDNVSVTLQAHLNRTMKDLVTIAKPGMRLRLVKGVYNEKSDISLSRGYSLDQRYLNLVDVALKKGVKISCATQDLSIIESLRNRELLDQIEELEMLHGVNSEPVGELNKLGVKVRITCVYGTNWYLHFLHRLAENPENVIVALADFYNPKNINYGY